MVDLYGGSKTFCNCGLSNDSSEFKTFVVFLSKAKVMVTKSRCYCERITRFKNKTESGINMYVTLLGQVRSSCKYKIVLFVRVMVITKTGNAWEKLVRS